MADFEQAKSFEAHIPVQADSGRIPPIAVASSVIPFLLFQTSGTPPFSIHPTSDIAAGTHLVPAPDRLETLPYIPLSFQACMAFAFAASAFAAFASVASALASAFEVAASDAYADGNRHQNTACIHMVL